MGDKHTNTEAMRMLKHDIKNHLSSIHLALETLKYEIATPSEDITYCLETIHSSAAKINELLKDTE